MSEVEFEVYELLEQGKNVKEIAKIKERSLQTLYQTIERIKSKGFQVNTNAYDPPIKDIKMENPPIPQEI